jgi:UDP-N-acetylmuramyl pentapeptide phosphotransferase/UDP-N-acetylglucosamine-1-phosphate transferase
MFLDISVILSLLTAFIIVFTTIPTIVYVAKAKKLYDQPDDRKTHKSNITALGGIAIFASLLITIGIYTDFSVHHEFQYLFVATIILFFFGLKDDILILAPIKKLWGQLLAALIVILLGDIRFTSLHGFNGIAHIDYLPSILLTLFVFIVIINGFNLIDGIDGLAAGVGIIASFVFGIFFILNCDLDYAIITATLAGSLIMFFWFNVFSSKYKVFMGDSGSLLIGLFIAVIAVRFNEMNIDHTNLFFIRSAPAVSIGILIVPLFDTLRVFIIRLFHGRSPFEADTNHVHHKLLAMGMSHLKATLFILGVNVIFVIIAFSFEHLGIFKLLLLNLILAIFFSLLPEIIFKLREKKFKQDNS